MCAIIFAAKAIDERWVLGFDASVPWVGDDDNLDGNSGGLGKPFPMGPVCNVNGVEVPTICCASENGSITADLLVEMLASIDNLGVFDRSDGVAPFLLLDGHGSRFDLKFLQYINTEKTSGMFALVCRMVAQVTGKLEIVRNRMVALRWRLQSTKEIC